MEAQIKSTRIIIVGGGLVGSLSACYFGQRGYKVDVYEYRPDPRSCDLVKGRSINLALSVRGRTALSKVGVQPPGIPMAGRMTHPVKGKKRAIPYDPVYNQCISSVSRKHLNEVLLTEAEKFTNVNLHFGHKIVAVDFSTGKATFKNNDITVEATGDLIVGADGAFSAVRRQMMKLPMFNFSQSYIEHGYMELSIPPTDKGEFAMDPGYLHIWPRGKFMMIALPNLDKTWTVTLFMPIAQFSALNSSAKVLKFFKQYFPDSVDLIGETNLVQDFLSSKASHLVSVKCKPYHVGSKAVIIGDAAHAMVPFFGQGMNAGFEDCRILDDLLHNHGYTIEEALKVYSETRNPDAEAICDLAMYNYIEMRDLVNRKTFLIRKYFDNFLYGIIPSLWIPLYQSVTFSHMSYSECTKNRKWQDTIISRGTIAVLTIAVAFSFFNNFLQTKLYNMN